MNQRLLVLLVLAVFFPVLGFAQQVSQYSLHTHNPYVYNPAYAGTGNSLEAAGVFRKQWLGLEGSPSTQHLNFHLPIHYLSSGVGMNIENEMLGALRNSKITLGYAYHFELGEKSFLSLGVSGGLVQLSFDGTKLLAPEGLYEGSSFEHNDMFLPENRENAMTYTLDAGIYLKAADLEVGFSSLHLTESRADFAFSEGADFQFRRHYTGFVAYRIGVGENIGIRPTIFAKSDLVQTQLDFSVSLDYDRRYIVGAAYRGYSKTTNDALNIHAGLKLTRQWMLIYGYDFSLSGLREVNQGSHEVMLKYDLGKTFGQGRPPKIIHTPRLL